MRWGCAVPGQSSPERDAVDGAHGARERPARLPVVALVAGAILAFAVPRFVQPLNLVDVLAFPFGYYMAAQGILIGLLIVGIISARWHNRREGRDAKVS